MRKLLVVLIIILIILIPFSIVLAIPKIELDSVITNNNVDVNGDGNIIIDYGEDYKPQFEAKSIFDDYTKDVVVKSNVDTSKVGKYEVNYELKFGLFKIKNKKLVEVVDRKKPVITLEGESEEKVCPNKKYEEAGYTAIDEYDGDISDKVDIEEEENKIIYIVSDKAGNKIEVIRNIIYEDNDNPVIELKGKSEVSIYKNNKYEEAGYSASDNCDGDLTKEVKVSGEVDSSKVGKYNIKYEVSDSNGNRYSVDRIVNVIEKPVYNSSNYSGNSTGKIFLTFDDGPSALTSTILDILDSEGVKATFFVTQNINSYPGIAKRAYNSGNVIALHTYTHNYSSVYASDNAYFSDLDKISNAVYEIIGVRSKYIRFPGGSSNTISRNYSVGIMSRITQGVVNRGYNYFDWNVDSNDAGGAVNNSNAIYSNVVNGLSHNKTNMVLMHDSGGHSATVNALRNIIQYGKNNGYTFAVIDDSTANVRHGVNN